MDGIFEGVRVLDFTQVLAGPTATRLLVEQGAEVIKVEFAPAGDPGRSLPRVRGRRSGYHVQQNRGKLSLCMDLRAPQARELIFELLPTVDVVIQNFGRGVMERLGFGYDALSAANPRLVVCNMTAFGTSGPLADKPGYDPIAQAWAGVLHMLGYPDRPPVLAGISPGDVLTGVHAFGGVAAALYHRERTGLGQEVTVSLLGAYATAHEVNWQEWSVSEGASEPIRRGSVHPVVGGVGVFAAGDGHVVIAAVNDGQWERLCAVMERPDLCQPGATLATGPGRVDHRDDANGAIAEWMASQAERDDVAGRLDDARVPCAPVLTLAEAAQHPFLHEAGAIRWVDDDVLGRVLVPGMPLRFSVAPDDRALAARHLGADNHTVVCELLGRTDAEFDRLVADGVLHADQGI